MDNANSWEVLLAWMTVLVPLILFDIAAIKWGVYTSGNHGPGNSLEL